MAKEDVYSRVIELCEMSKESIEKTRTLDEAKMAGVMGISMIVTLVGGALAESKNCKKQTHTVKRKVYHAES